MPKRAKRYIEVQLIFMRAVSPVPRISSPLVQSTRCAQTVHCFHLNSITPALCEIFNRAGNVSKALGVLRYLSFQAAQWLLAVAICSAVASMFCWIMTPHSSNWWYLSKERAPDTDATGNRMSSQGRNVDWEHASQKIWANFNLN